MKVGRMLRGVFLATILMGTFAGCGGGDGTTSSNQISTATFSGKSFTTGDHTVVFNADGTITQDGVNVNESWTVNSSGQLVIYSTSRGTETVTLSGDSTHGWTGTGNYSDGTTSGVTLTPPAVLSTSMLSGKTLSAGIGNSALTFNVDGTLSQNGFETSMTWTVNGSGQLVIYGTSSGTEIFTLFGDSINGWKGIGVYSNGTSSNITFTPA